MRALITGARGFVGSYLNTELETNDYEVIRCDLTDSDGIIAMDILDPKMTFNIISDYKPYVLINLAGQANVGLS